MGKALQSRKWTLLSLGLVFAMLAGLITLGVFFNYKMELIDSKTVFMEGSYSIDDASGSQLTLINP